ncbi:hypothetical protein MJG53_014610 [Ovis ammon polii x Ovis aries]|uniref:Uncharacterized protein n=2 Tax=Ovis TaxID=9935 RepID=A0A835ZY68_SHEEP|nr:hypothetical protein JEQ12_007482 [Ovis aries]KAI4568992.1 hypothetical protein MJG53_014610 [Ovis ammon polii x Ovis aries]
MAATPTSEKLAEGHVALPKLVQDSNKSSNLESGSEPGKLHFEHTPRGSSAYPCLKPTDVAESGGYSPVVVCGLLTVVASLVAKHWL